MYAEKASRSNLTAGYSTGRTAERSEVSAGMGNALSGQQCLWSQGKGRGGPALTPVIPASGMSRTCD